MASMSTPDNPTGDPRLVELVSECLARLEDEGAAVVEQLCAREPALAVALRARVERLRELGLLEELSPANAIPERLGEFRLVRRLASGGMGVVYEAEQASLGRRVALKLVRPDMLYFDGARARFRREVDAVAKLSHPGIAQIHAVGEEQGLPYFAMELVAGASLGDVLTELRTRAPSALGGADLHAAVARRAPRDSSHGSRPQSLFSSSWVDSCVRVAREVAAIMAYAHAQGVLHRDLKPSNVLLTPSGRVVVVDFGLAAVAGSGRVTRTGSQLGSLPYMAPEQLRGDVARIDARTDVYALGVTLYEMLTLTLPYQGESSPVLEREIGAGSPRAMRELNSAVSRDLETVVLCAIDGDRARRYAGIEEFGQDLERVLAHRPVSARRIGPMGRAARWCRRHPGGAASAVLATLVFGVGPSVWAWNEARTNAVIGKERNEARRASERAQAHLRVAMESAELLARRGNVRSASDLATLFERSLQTLESLDSVDVGDEGVDLYRVRLMHLLGDTLRSNAKPDEAVALYARMDALFVAKLAARPGDAMWSYARALGRNNLGSVLQDRGERQEAARAHAEAIELLRTAEADPAWVAVARSTRVVAHHNLARTLNDMGQAEEAIRAADEALATAELVLRETREPLQRMRAAVALAQRGRFAFEREGLEACEPRFRRAIDLLEQAVADDVQPSPLREQLSAVTMEFGTLLARSQRFDDAEPVLLRAAELLRELDAELPGAPTWANHLAEVLFGRAFAAIMTQRHPEARELLEQARALREDLVRRFPADRSCRVGLAATLSNFGQFEMDQGQLEQALAHSGRALELFGTIGASSEHSTYELFNHTATRILHADVLARLGREAEAAAELERAEALETLPPPLRVEMARVWTRLAAAKSQGEASSSESAALRAIDCLRAALEAGAIERSALAVAAEFTALREHPDFRALCGD